MDSALMQAVNEAIVNQAFKSAVKETHRGRVTLCSILVNDSEHCKGTKVLAKSRLACSMEALTFGALNRIKGKQ